MLQRRRLARQRAGLGPGKAEAEAEAGTERSASYLSANRGVVVVGGGGDDSSSSSKLDASVCIPPPPCEPAAAPLEACPRPCEAQPAARSSSSRLPAEQGPSLPGLARLHRLHPRAHRAAVLLACASCYEAAILGQNIAPGLVDPAVGGCASQL